MKSSVHLSGQALHELRTQAQQAQRKRHQQQERVLGAYSFDVRGFIDRYLGWQPWEGHGLDAPGQGEIIDAYQDIIRAQIERLDLEAGVITQEECTVYDPSRVQQQILHIAKGHNTGGTKIASALVNHFLHTFTPSIVYTYAPGWKQIKNLLWKEILSDRRGSGLPGKTLKGALRIDITPEHFATGVATKHLTREDVQGQHQRYLMFVFDEAEGIQDFVYDAVRTMASGGVVIILMLANPRTRTSRFHREGKRPEALALRMSCLQHPNVATGRQVIPGAVTRQHVADMIRDHCDVVGQHSDDDYTFDLPWPVRYHRKDGTVVEHPGGTVFRGDGDFLYQVLGIPPVEGAGDVLVSVARYDAACQRKPEDILWVDDTAYIGVDVARFGTDKGCFYSRYQGVLKRFARVDDAVTGEYIALIEQQAQVLRDLGAQHLSIRIDGTGGFGAGVIDGLRESGRLLYRWFQSVAVHEVHFGSSSYTPRGGTSQYADIITQCYAETNETLLGLSIESPPGELELDLCDRKYTWVNQGGISVKRLESKDREGGESFRGRHSRSPDDGDACALCCAPDHIFARHQRKRTRATVGANR